MVPAARFDARTVFRAVWPPLVAWLALVLGGILTGYPGTVCVTPVGWLLALLVGRNCAWGSPSARPAGPLVEAAVAGALLGLAQGVLFTLVVLLAMPLQAGEVAPTLVLTGLMTAVSAVVCSLVAAGFAAVVMRRMAISG